MICRSRRDGRAISCVGEKKWQKDSSLRGISIPPYVIGFEIHIKRFLQVAMPSKKQVL